MAKKKTDNYKEFMRKNYVACPKCQYNNERTRLKKYGTCLNCGAVLDNKMHFMIEMKKRIDQDKKRRG